MKSVKIKNIKKVKKEDRYDLTVPKNHNFFANGILIHNTSGRTAYTPSPIVETRVQRFFRILLGK